MWEKVFVTSFPAHIYRSTPSQTMRAKICFHVLKKKSQQGEKVILLSKDTLASCKLQNEHSNKLEVLFFFSPHTAIKKLNGNHLKTVLKYWLNKEHHTVNKRTPVHPSPPFKQISRATPWEFPYFFGDTRRKQVPVYCTKTDFKHQANVERLLHLIVFLTEQLLATCLHGHSVTELKPNLT